MDLKNLHPAKADHSVLQALFAIEWANPLASAAPLSRLRDANLPTVEKDFPSPQKESRGVGVIINMTDGHQALSTTTGDELLAISFEKLNDIGAPVRFLSISRDRIVLGFNEYTRWQQVLDKAKVYFAEIMTALQGDGVEFDSIGLQYTDVFNWKDKPSSLDLNHIFNQESDYVAHNLIKSKDLCHCHHGYFENSLHQADCKKLLNNVNIEINEDDGFRKINITTTHQAKLTKNHNNYDHFSKTHEELLNELHQKNKSILINLLTDEVRKKINLTA